MLTLDLEEKLKTYEAQLNKEKQKLMDVKTNIKDLEADAVKVSEENVRTSYTNI